MLEKLKELFGEGKSMLEDAFVIPDDDDFDAIPPGVTEEQLIEEARQYVDAILVERKHHSHKDDSEKPLVAITEPEEEN